MTNGRCRRMCFGDWRRWGSRLAFGAMLTCVGTSVVANVTDDGRPTDRARASLQENDFPWYDRETDALKSVTTTDRVPTPPSEMKGWDVSGSDFDLPSFNWPSFDTSGFWNVIQWMVWVAMGAALIAALVYVVHRMWHGGFDFNMSRSDSVPQKVVTESTKIEHLPFSIDRPKTDLLAEARQHYENGDYAHAIIYLFSYQLVVLDKNHLIRLAKGKTNRQYLRELGNSRNSLRDTLQRTMIVFEDVFFGNHRLERQRFEACWQRLDDFHHDVQQRSLTGAGTP